MTQQSVLSQGSTIAFRRPQESSQVTLCAPVSISGRGLFHGIEAQVTLRPADENSGIVFRRMDLKHRPMIAARVENVASAARRTVLSHHGATVETVEHLMAALAGLQIDNCLVDISGPEVPAVDGSALPFCEAILHSGVQKQSAARPVYRVRECHAAAGDGGERIEITPLYDTVASLCYQLDYGVDSPLPRCALTVSLSPEDFLQEIAAARTFVLEDEIESLQQMGFGRHLTARDIVVFNRDGSITDNELRWADEPVRHKILDCIGDLALCGTPFVGQLVARRSGHKLNHVMASIVSMMSGRGIVGNRAA